MGLAVVDGLAVGGDGVDDVFGRAAVDRERAVDVVEGVIGGGASLHDGVAGHVGRGAGVGLGAGHLDGGHLVGAHQAGRGHDLGAVLGVLALGRVGHGPAAVGEGGAVELLLAGGGGDRHRARLDGELAGVGGVHLELLGHVRFAVPHGGGAGDRGGVLAGVGAGGLGGKPGHGVGLAVERELVKRHALGGLLGAVVGVGRVGRGRVDHVLGRAIGHPEDAVDVLELVVGGLPRLHDGVAGHVGRGAGVGLGAGHLDGGHLVGAHQAGALGGVGHLPAGGGEGGAVELLLGGVGGDRHRARLDYMLPRLHADLIGMLPGVKLAILIVDLYVGSRFHRNYSVGASIDCRAIGVIVLRNLGLITSYVEDLSIFFRPGLDSVSNALDILQICKGSTALVAVINRISRVGSDHEVIFERLPLSGVGHVGGHRGRDLRRPAVEREAPLDGISGRLRRNRVLSALKFHLRVITRNQTAVQVVGDRELCLLPFGGVGDVLGNGVGDGGIPAIELPAVLTRLVAHKLRRRHSSQDVLSRLLSERSMLTGQIGNTVTILLAIRNIVAIGIPVVDDLSGDVLARHLPGDSRRIGHVPLNRGRYNIVAVTKFEPILNMSLRQQTFIRIGSAVFVELICHSKRICLLLYGIRAVEMPCVSSVGRLICVP